MGKNKVWAYNPVAFGQINILLPTNPEQNMVERGRELSAFQFHPTKNYSEVPSLKKLTTQKTVHCHKLNLVVTQNERRAWLAWNNPSFHLLPRCTFYSKKYTSKGQRTTSDMITKCEEKRRKRESQYFSWFWLSSQARYYSNIVHGSKKVLLSPSEMVLAFVPSLAPKWTE